MDLRDAAQRLRLDLDTASVSESLSRAGLPHALLKGPSTATWLYDPPRVYNDIDLLVPRSQVRRAVRALAGDGVARRSGGRVGEEAHHSLAMRTATGYELDLHVSLSCVPVRGDLVWNTLASHVVDLDLGVGVVPALDEPGRCLVVALHALGSDGRLEQKVEDLRRARDRADSTSWSQARELARRMRAEDLYDGGLARLADAPPELSHRASLYFTNAPSAALALQRLRDARWWERPVMVWREAFPSAAFLRDTGSVNTGSRWWRLAAYVVRVSELIGMLRSLRSASPRWPRLRAASPDQRRRGRPWRP